MSAIPDTPGAEERVREFIEWVSVNRTGEDRFRAETPNWGFERVFGGVILGQSMHAAATTVSDGKRVHSLHGYFLRPAIAGKPLEYRVERPREGRSFATRSVTALQDDKEIFSMTSSFGTAGTGRDYQKPLAPDAPDPETLKQESWGAVEIRDVGETPPDPDGFHRSTGRMWYRLAGPLADNPAIHAAALAFLSDMTRTSARPPSLGRTASVEGLISLDHAVWFHRPIRPDAWLLYDIDVLVHAEGRGLLRGTMHSQDGMLGLSMAQEMMILPPRPEEET